MKNYLYFTLIFAADCASANRMPPPPTHGDDLAFNDIKASEQARSAAPDNPLPTFIEDDYARALAEAKAKHVPLFVDAWASWCHSCVSLRNFVFKDPRIALETRHFVWLSIDTENPKNADFIAKFPNAVLPTLRVIKSDAEDAAFTWEGTMTAPELVATLDDIRGAAPEGRTRDAHRGQLISDANVMDFAKRGDNEKCAAMAYEIGPALSGTQAVDVAVTGTDCAVEIKDDRLKQMYLPPLLDTLKKITRDMSLPILADDRSGAYEALVDAGNATGEKAAAKENAVAWAAFLEGEAKNAKSPAERAVFDPHRLLAYLALGQPQRAIAMLEQSQKDFPDDFNPPARLARAYLEMGKYDDAVAASDKALALANGPRRVKISLVKADALSKKGDVAGERKTIADSIAFLSTLPAADVSPKMKSVLEARLAKIEASDKPAKKLPARH